MKQDPQTPETPRQEIGRGGQMSPPGAPVEGGTRDPRALLIAAVIAIVIIGAIVYALAK